MRYLALYFLTGLSVAAQGFVNGQAARLVIGQTNFTKQDPNEPPSEWILGGVSGLAYANNTLFVADSSRVGAGPTNNRVLVYRDLTSIVPRPTDELGQGGARCPICIGPASVVLGQPNFNSSDLGLATGMRLPTAVASDGNVVAVADTDNNRVLIWRSIPASNGQPPDLVLGQENLTSVRQATVDAKSLRGPQGVWIQNGKLFVADTVSHRVLIWNSIPSQNDAPADLVLGQPNFTTVPQPDLTRSQFDSEGNIIGTAANTLLNPVSVTSDGVRLYVTDLGNNRVLIWNNIPTQNQAPADLVLGQPDFAKTIANNSPKMCAPVDADGNGEPDKDDEDNIIYPPMCASTLNFPRFALSDGKRLFIADGGNDRIVIYDSLPTQNGQPSDQVIGQLSATVNNTSDSALPDYVAASDVLRTPMSLAWDGTNLYASDTFNRRVLVFTPADPKVPYTGVRNAASFEVFALGDVTLAGEVKVDDEVTIKIVDKEYKYKAVADDTLDKIMTELVNLINADTGDPNVVATPLPALLQVRLTARVAGGDGNNITYEATMSSGATITATAAGAALSGGQDAAKLAGGTIVSIVGERLSEETASAPADATSLPRELANVRVYFDGIEAPLIFVSPNQINAQLPWEVLDAQGANAVVRTRRSDGSIEVSSAIAVPLIGQNPGIFAGGGLDPRPGAIFHGSSYPSAMIDVGGTATTDNVATVIIADREYSYTVVTDPDDGDTSDDAEDNARELAKVRDGLIAAINAGGGDPDVEASPAGVFTRILLRGRRPGPDLNGLPFSTKISDGATVILSPSNVALCCANIEGAPVTAENPAVPGERLIVMATGLGKIMPDDAQAAVVTGEKYSGPFDNQPVASVNSLAGGKTANILSARLKQGEVGIYEVLVELNSDMPTNPETQMYIAQSIGGIGVVSNLVRFPLKNPNDEKPVPEAEAESARQGRATSPRAARQTAARKPPRR